MMIFRVGRSEEQLLLVQDKRLFIVAPHVLYGQRSVMRAAFFCATLREQWSTYVEITF